MGQGLGGTKQLDVSMGGKNAIIRLEADGTVKELY
jgi:hypothetical protein